MKHISSSAISSVLSPSLPAVELESQTTGKSRRLSYQTPARSPRTPDSVKSTPNELKDTPITPPDEYEELRERFITDRIAKVGKKSQQLQDSINGKSDLPEVKISLFQTLNPFSELKIDSLVGLGQWSQVCKAYDCSQQALQSVERIFAAKIPNSKFSRNIIRHEAQILTYLKSNDGYSQHLVGFHGFDLLHQALVLEYLGPFFGLTLCNALDEETCKPIAIAKDLIHGLAFLHGAEVIHGDIKPDNIFVRCVPHEQPVHQEIDHTKATKSSRSPMKYRAVYIDFSASRFDLPGFQPTESAGTYDYMAPELFSNAQNSYTTKESDIYSLGITLMTAAAGRNPYDSAPNLISRRAMAMQGIPAHFMAEHVDSWNRFESSKIKPLVDLALIKIPSHRCNADEWKAIVDREWMIAAT